MHPGLTKTRGNVAMPEALGASAAVGTSSRAAMTSGNACTDLAQRMPPGVPPSMTNTCPVIDSARQNMTTCAAMSSMLAT